MEVRAVEHLLLLPVLGEIDPITQVMLYTILIFVVLVVLLRKFAWSPLTRALEEREQRIAKRIGDAEAALKAAEAQLAEYERKLAHAQEETAEIIAEGKRDVEKLREETLAAAQAEAARTLERARREVVLYKEAAVQELREQMVKLAAEAAREVVRREVNEEDHRRFVQNATAKLNELLQA
jgi:F-type H+-transporting ATPase subunit b